MRVRLTVGLISSRQGSDMLQIDVWEFQQDIADYLKRVGNGEEIQIASNGRVVARVVPVTDGSYRARKRLESLRGTVIKGDVLSTGDENGWSADVDHL